MSQVRAIQDVASGTQYQQLWTRSLFRVLTYHSFFGFVNEALAMSACKRQPWKQTIKMWISAIQSLLLTVPPICKRLKFTKNKWHCYGLPNTPTGFSNRADDLFSRFFLTLRYNLRNIHQTKLSAWSFLHQGPKKSYVALERKRKKKNTQTENVGVWAIFISPLCRNALMCSL